MKLAAIKLTVAEHAAIQGLIAKGEYRTLSHVLRDGLQEIFNKHHLELDALVEIRRQRIFHPMRGAKLKAVDAPRPHIRKGGDA